MVDCAGTGKSTVCPRTGSRRTRSPLPLTARRRERQWRAPIGGSGATAGAALTRSIGTSGEPAQRFFSKQRLPLEHGLDWLVLRRRRKGKKKKKKKKRKKEKKEKKRKRERSSSSS